MPGRPPLVGHYELLEDFVTEGASVRVIALDMPGEAVGLHIHEHSAQIYLALEGEVIVRCGDVEKRLRPYESLAVPRGVAHAVRPAGDVAVIANISTPPLDAADQVPVLDA